MVLAFAVFGLALMGLGAAVVAGGLWMMWPPLGVVAAGAEAFLIGVLIVAAAAEDEDGEDE